MINKQNELEKIVQLFESCDGDIFSMSNEVKDSVSKLIPSMNEGLIERVVDKVCRPSTLSSRNAVSVLSGLSRVDNTEFAIAQVAKIDESQNYKGRIGVSVMGALVILNEKHSGPEASLAMGKCLAGGRYDMGNLELSVQFYEACKDEFMTELVRLIGSQSMYQVKRRLLKILGYLSWKHGYAFTEYFMPLFVRSKGSDKELMVSAICLHECKSVPSIETELGLIMMLQELYKDHTSDTANILLCKMLCYNDTALAMAHHLVDCQAYIENLPTVLRYMENASIPNAYQIEELCYRMLTEDADEESIEEATQTLIHLGKVYHVGIIDVISERVKNSDDEFLTDYLLILSQNGLAARILEALPAKANMLDLPYLTALNDAF